MFFDFVKSNRNCLFFYYGILFFIVLLIFIDNWFMCFGWFFFLVKLWRYNGIEKIFYRIVNKGVG